MEREMEYSKDRLNAQIRDLMRENSFFKDALYRKDKERIELDQKLIEANEHIRVLGAVVGAVTIALIFATVAAIRHWGGAP